MNFSSFRNEINSRNASVKELINEFFSKIDSKDPEINSYISTTKEIAIAQSENIDQLISLSAGPHTLTIVKDGFYRANGRFSIKPGLVHDEKITLIPAQETIAAYESKANTMRYSAYATGVLALGSAFLSGYFYNQATDNKLIVDSYASALESERAQTDRRNEALSAKDSFDTNQSLYVVSLSTAVLSAAGSALLFMFGEDPSRYDAFSKLEK